MKYFRSIVIASICCLGLSAAAWAQMGRMGMGMRPPNIPGEFKPVVGSGAQYKMSGKQGDMDWAYAVVGKESVDGAEGYWMEMRLLGGKGAGAIMKQLMVISGSQPGIKRMIMQMPPRPPMELPIGMMGMMGGMARNAPESHAGGGPHELGEVVGTETITVPAGTFETQHYRRQDGTGTSDVWVSTKVSPYGLVKMTSPEMSMELEKVLSNETSQIKGEPQKMGMGMPGMPPQ